MLIAFTLWLLTKFGIHIPPERITQLEEEFYGRPSLVNLHFGRQFIVDAPDAAMLGIGYERHFGKQRYVGAGFLADVILPRDVGKVHKADFLLATQLYVHPIRPLELTYAIGPSWFDGDLRLFNRFGAGYRMATLHFAPVPSFWVDLIGKEPRYTLGAQIEF